MTTLIMFELLYGVALAQLFRGRVDGVAREVRRRANELHLQLGEGPRITPAVRRKLEFLYKVINPTGES